MSLYTAFVMVTLTLLAMPILYGEWKRQHAVKESVPSGYPHSETEPHAETEPMRRAA
jgi:hypothetical protein